MFVCCVGCDRNGRLAVGDVRAQTQQAIDNIRADWAPMNEVYFANFTHDPPHRVSCIVKGLGSPECLVEIDATAYLGDNL